MVSLGQASLPRPLPAAAPRPRPPTPPRESEKHETGPGSFKRVLAASTITPNSSAESPNPSSRASRKRVEWDDLTTSSPAPSSSSGQRKPIKSILKPYNGAIFQTLDLGTAAKLSPPHAYANLAAMLESIAQQLAGKDRNSRMDAYTTLSGTIKAYDNVPDVRALKEKMGLLQQFMMRDLAARTTTGSTDTALIVNDLVLLSSFLHKPAIAELLSSDFSAFVVDHAIKTFEDPGMSKDVVKHLMFVLAQQSFPAKIMNAERCTRLITALHEIDNYVKGKSIVIGRINIYRNLVRKSRSHMLANLVWLEDLFSDMLSSLRDTRAAAIDFGLEAALVLGTESRASRAVMDLFQREREDDRSVPKFGEYLAQRLKAMVHKKQEGGSSSVPQIWSVVILFLRCRPRQFEQWSFRGDWLVVIQECFNCSDQQTKLEANLAWNRLVFAIRPDEKTPPTIITMLCRPLLEQLKRKGKSTSKSRKATLGSLCVLLYYSLRPNPTTTHLDLYWNHYVLQIVGKTLIPTNASGDSELVRQDLTDACLILRGLFDSTTPRPWKETRAMDFSTTDMNMQMSELPALDSKWLRKSSSVVFPVLQPLLQALYWDLGREGTAITSLWNAYNTSIASPAVKEIKVPNETMSCVACTFNLLYRIWHTGPTNLQCLPGPSGSRSENFLESFATIILSMVDKLGPLPFTEKLLSIGSQDTFVVIATPSHRPRNTVGEIQCPLHHLFVLLTSVCPDLEYDVKFEHMVRRILTPFFNARPSSKAKMDFIQELLRLLPAENTDPCKMIWQILAEFATTPADPEPRDGRGSGSNNSYDQPLGGVYSNALKILELGIDISPRDPMPGWKVLFESLVTSATADAGDGGRAIAVIEPLARAFSRKLPKGDEPSNYGLAYFRIIVFKANYPKDRQALDAARRRLWGAAPGGSKQSSYDPYAHLYEYMQKCLEKSYTSYSRDHAIEYSEMLSATTALLNRCPDAIRYDVYVKLQIGISRWILDEDSKLSGGTAYSQALTSLWAKVCSQLPLMIHQHSHSKILADLEPLLCSGLETRHRAIVNTTIRLWNSTFGDCEEKFEYPPRIKEALLRLRPVAELQLPFFPDSLESEGSAEHRQPLSFADSQDDSSNFFGSSSIDSMLRRQPMPRLNPPRSRRSTPQVLIEIGQSFQVAGKRSREATPEPGKANPRKRISTQKLRHDDSQVQFEAIESSPIADTIVDSQLLTDRQKEVKERQKAEAAMFPDLRSTPRTKGGPSSVELAFRRSASKARSVASPDISPDIERQTTPTLLPQGEEDDYVNSSPTPTRALPQDEISELPSSPPEAIEREPVVKYEDEMDFPSSPPEIIEDQGNDNTTSLDPSAQIDPDAPENNPTLSVLDGNQDEQVEVENLGLPVSAATSNAEDNALPTSNVRPGQSSPGAGPSQAKAYAMEGPSTPTHEHSDVPEGQQTSRSPVFHDALSSPVSSDRPTANEEIFQDAISSPRLNLGKAEPKQDSPSLSDFDESSMLRLVKEFDEGSGRPRRSVRFSVGKENQPGKQPVSADSPCPATTANVSFDTSAGDVPEVSVTELDGTDKAYKGLTRSSGKASVSSSLPSLIPETPGTKASAMVQTVDEEAIDPDDTIVVEVPENYQVYKAPRRRRNKAAFTRVRDWSASPKKRKHEEAAEEQHEVPDSQEVKADETSPKKRPSAKKRRRRSKRGSQVSSQTTDPEPEATQSFSSMELDVSTQNTQETDSMTDIRASSAKDARDDVGVTTPHSVGKRESRGGKTGGETAGEASVDTSSKEASDVEIAAETTVDDSNILDSTHEEGGVSIVEVNTRSSGEEPHTEEVPTAQSIRDKLQSLISDLDTASLTREEVNAFEDLFMDAKEKLYGAARRGRARK